jgi:hypothetical protein
MPWGELADRGRGEQSGPTISTAPGSPGSGLGMLSDRAGMLGGQLDLIVDPDPDAFVVQRLTLPVPGYDS